MDATPACGATGGWRGCLRPGAAALLLSLALFTLIQFAGPNIVGYDSYYHIKMAELIREQGLPVRFPWLKFTILDERGYTDHHMLLHLLEVPFTWLGDLELAAKLAPIAFASLAFTAIFLTVRGYGVGFPFFWLLLLFASSSPFLFRMSMVRGQSLSLALQVLAFHAIMTRRAVALGVVSAVFVWAYNGFPLLIPLVLFGALTHYLAERKIEYRLVLAVGVGIAAGLVVNPYFPRNVVFLWGHIVPKLFAVSYQTTVGSEWYPYSTWALLRHSAPALLAYLGGLALLDPRDWRRDRPRLFWLLTATMFLFLLLKSRRFIEYFPPAAVMFLAFSVRARLQGRPGPAAAGGAARLARAAAAAILLSALAVTLAGARRMVAGQPPTSAYRGAALWLRENTPPGSTVFHTDWDDFPMLFFHNTHNVYLVGLDPDFMRLKNPRLFRLWESIAAGKVRRPEKDIVRYFGSRYVVTDRKHKKFSGIADRSPRMERVFSDRSTTVYRILDAEETGSSEPGDPSEKEREPLGEGGRGGVRGSPGPAAAGPRAGTSPAASR